MKRMKIIITLIIVLLAFASRTDARLGETKEQCEKRYGEHYDFTLYPKLNVSFYMKNDYKVVAYFLDGVCQRIDYKNEGYDGSIQPLSKKEIEVFLSSNAQNSKWIEVDDHQWGRKDNSAIATYYKSQYCLVITTEKWINAQKEDEEAETEEELYGF